jgi:hypothetical protein
MGGSQPEEVPDEAWEAVLEHLSNLITFKNRADGKGWRDAFENMPIYLEVGDRCRLPVLQDKEAAGTA